MKLIRTIPKNDIERTCDTIIIENSDDVEFLKSQGEKLAFELNCERPFWSNTLPIMGDDKIKNVKEFTLNLPNDEKLRITY
jgi:hypothetical protein